MKLTKKNLKTIFVILFIIIASTNPLLIAFILDYLVLIEVMGSSTFILSIFYFYKAYFFTLTQKIKYIAKYLWKALRPLPQEDK